MPRDEKNLVTNENETIKNKMKEKFAGTYPFPRDMDFQNEGEAYATWETLGFSPSAQKYFEQALKVEPLNLTVAQALTRSLLAQKECHSSLHGRGFPWAPCPAPHDG